MPARVPEVPVAVGFKLVEVVPAVFAVARLVGVMVLLGGDGTVVVGPFPAIVSADGCRLQGNQLAVGDFMLDVQPDKPIEATARLAAKACIQGAILNRMFDALHCVRTGLWATDRSAPLCGRAGSNG
jgi:hypothetical protein